MGSDRQAEVSRSAPSWMMLPALLMAAPAVAASAPSVSFQIPAGRLGDAVAALAGQAGVSVSVPDAALWARPVPALNGRMTVRDAVRRLATAAGGRAVALPGDGWRIVAGAPAAAARPSPQRAPAAAPLPAPAPESGSDIIVTASKRDARLGDYPATVNMIDGRDLAFGGEGGTDSILARLASLSSTHLGAGRNKLFIRGIADSSFTGPTQATVGQYFGDVRLSYNAPDPDLKLYDIAQVEVLEGPNGTLYGAGSLGGIIRVVRNAPRPGMLEGALSAGASLTQHGDPGADIGGMINLPMADDNMALRLVGYGVTEGGYIDNPLLDRKNVNRTDTYGGRATLRIAPGDGWTIDIGATYQDIHGADSQYADRDGPRLTRSTLVDQGFDGSYALGDLVVTKDWDDLRLVSSTGIARQKLGERYDATVPDGPADDGTAINRLWPLLAVRVAGVTEGVPMAFTQHNNTRFFSHETRLSRPTRDGFGWVVGASYLDNRAKLRRSLGPDGLAVPLTGVINRIREYTAYGEASVEVLRDLTFTAGGRVTHSRLSGEGVDIALPYLAPENQDEGTALQLAAANARLRAARGETNVSPSLALSAQLMPDLVFFLRYQEGFRPGGLAIEDQFVRRFKGDQVKTWESGFRHGGPGDAFMLATSFSYTRWQDIQADYIDATGLPTTANIGDGRIYSIAANAGWRPFAGLGIDAAIIYNDSKVSDPAPAITLGRLSQLPNVAEWSARGGVDYRAILTDDLDLRVGANLRYVGRSRLGVGPILGEAQGDYVDTALSVRIGRPDLGVTLTLTNLADAVGNRFALGTPFLINRIDQITPLRPRTVRLGLDAHF